MTMGRGRPTPRGKGARVPARVIWGAAALALLPGCSDAPHEQLLTETVLEEVRTVGVLDGPEEFILGEVTEVLPLVDGSFLVLDRQAPAVRWYGPDGDHRDALTATGDGPGQPMLPVALALLGEDRFAVMDQGTARISTYRATEGRLQAEGTTRVAPLDPYALNRRNLCALDDRLFVQQLADGEAVQIYDSSGARQGGFQDPIPIPAGFEGYEFLLEPSLNSAILLCTSEPDLVVSVPFRSDTVRAFAQNGDEVWTVSLPDVSPEGYQTEPAFGFETDSEGSHVAAAALRWSDGSILVQYRFWSGSRHAPDSTRVDSFELSLESGQELSRTTRLPVIQAARDRRVYTVADEPFPAVTVWTRD